MALYNYEYMLFVMECNVMGYFYFVKTTKLVHRHLEYSFAELKRIIPTDKH
ncbi:MAG: hypothetical protein KAG96_07185 [Ichthyobacteriaceae bacterium]|nr:hypothetical protein [Ichthyobacteriaceae bacterium]